MSINDFLMIALVLAAIRSREMVAVCIAATYLSHSVMDAAGYMDAYGYYLSSALIDSIFVLLIKLHNDVSMRVRAIQFVCLSFIPTQLIGVLIWYLYQPPSVYNAICSLLYVALIAILMTEEEGIGGNSKNTWLRIINNFDFCARFKVVYGDEAKK